MVYEYSGILIAHNVYQTLVTFEGSDLQTIKPSLADSWDTKDAGDHWELTFKLHPGNTFASGNPITADDVVYSFNRVLAINGSPAFLFTDVAGLTADSVKAVDPETVQINLPKTASPGAFLAILTNTVASVVDSKVVMANEGSDNGATWLLDHSAGSGAYVVDHWTKDVEVLLTANPNFAGDKPALTSVLIRHVPESVNQLTAAAERRRRHRHEFDRRAIGYPQWRCDQRQRRRPALVLPGDERRRASAGQGGSARGAAHGH